MNQSSIEFCYMKQIYPAYNQKDSKFNYLWDTPTPLRARDDAAMIDDFKPSDVDQSTVWSPAHVMPRLYFEFLPPDLIQYIMSPSLPDLSTASLFTLAQSCENRWWRDYYKFEEAFNYIFYFNLDFNSLQTEKICTLPWLSFPHDFAGHLVLASKGIYSPKSAIQPDNPKSNKFLTIISI